MRGWKSWEGGMSKICKSKQTIEWVRERFKRRSWVCLGGLGRDPYNSFCATRTIATPSSLSLWVHIIIINIINIKTSKLCPSMDPIENLSQDSLNILNVCVSVRANFWHPSPYVSTIWCSRPYKPYIFWKLIIWWWQWPRRILTKRQIQGHTYTEKDRYKVLPRPNVCYIYQKQGV